MYRFRYFFLLLFMSSALYACNDKNKRPQDILPKDKMREVLWDVMRTGEYLYTHVLYKDTAMDKAAQSQLWYEKIYQLHNISAGEFKKSYDWYKKHPQLMQEILDSITKIEPFTIPVIDTLQEQLLPDSTLPLRPVRDTLLRGTIDTLPVTIK